MTLIIRVSRKQSGVLLGTIHGVPSGAVNNALNMSLTLFSYKKLR
ncbi:hypothetical protein XCR1_1250018 [Xenorhabdus cabanillasii JM26]|uniref:Uncharacterized protein n=1 Tax=Xenorhabdus cabanillasii JM26 TaxID=1427517 RepID=W1IQC8_9GAMM|nr:hypothetical protein XCR1_1250018 [Xenorhabdus cabanillasii JM26]